MICSIDFNGYDSPYKDQIISWLNSNVGKINKSYHKFSVNIYADNCIVRLRTIDNTGELIYIFEINFDSIEVETLFLLSFDVTIRDLSLI